MASVLIAYSTTDGHARRIAQRLAAVVEGRGGEVTVASIDEEPEVDPGPFDKVVLGASVRYGRHDKQVYRFVDRHQKALESRPNAFFSVNVVARKPEKRTPATNPYVKKFLGEIDWQPREVAIFAGKIDYPRYRFWDRQMIRLIMWMTKGPTDPRSVTEFTDWEQVDAFGELVARM